MSRRYYLAPIVGSGTMADPYRARVDLHSKNWSAVIPSKPDGTPRFAWALCIVAAADHSALEADALLDKLPNIDLDRTLADLSAAQRTALATRLQALGVDTSGVSASTTMRQVLRRVGQTLAADFDEGQFGVAE
jgi:hypothetical protein